jgi:hypothetical protein
MVVKVSVPVKVPFLAVSGMNSFNRASSVAIPRPAPVGA